MKIKPHHLRTDDMTLTKLYKHREALMQEIRKLKTPKSDAPSIEFNKWLRDVQTITDCIRDVNIKTSYLKGRGYKE